MTDGTKGGAQRARTLRAWVRRGGNPVTATPIYHLPSKAMLGKADGKLKKGKLHTEDTRILVAA
jgi:hypothetical protein